MPTNDDLTTDHPLPLFLSRHADEPDIGGAWDIAVISSRVLRAGLLVVTASAIGFVLADDPVALFANVKAALFDRSALQLASDRSTAAIQSTSSTQALQLNSADAPTREEIVAAFASARQSQAKISEPPAETLLKQFQTWAAKEDAKENAQAQVTRVQPVQATSEDAQPPARPAQPVQDTTAKVAEDARAPVHPVLRRRHVNARAEMRPVQNPGRMHRREQNARAQVPPAPDGRVQDAATENAQAPSFVQSPGLHN
jgi:hypothetical protein